MAPTRRRGVHCAAMAPRRSPPKPSPKAAQRTADIDRVVVRGLSARDLAALDAHTARRRAALAAEGGTTSRNAVCVALLRAALASVGAYELPGVPSAEVSP
jgi:hypothetical protein